MVCQVGHLYYTKQNHISHITATQKNFLIEDKISDGWKKQQKNNFIEASFTKS